MEAPVQGKVLFSRDAASDAPTPEPANPPKPAEGAASKNNVLDDPEHDALKVTDAERTAPTFTAYDLDVHLTPATAGIAVRAGLTVRNDGAAPLARLVFQISSSLHWDAFSSVGLADHSDGTAQRHLAAPLRFAARSVETDADHTGAVQEAVIMLPEPLAPGASLALTALYSGAIPPSAERLERIGGPAEQALLADWDAIGSGGAGITSAALRGFGNALWYPVAAAPVFLGEGARLFQAVGANKLRQAAATMSLRLAVEFVGDAPDAAWFCGRREQLLAHSDNPDLPVADAPGIATAEFAPHPLGFRAPSLFVTDRPPSETDGGLVDAVTEHYDALAGYAAAAAQVAPLLRDWLGPEPLTRLTILDHPGQPFEDEALLVRPMQVVDAKDPTTLTPTLVHSLTHAWIRSTHAWIDEGLPQFLGLLWTERTAGREAALAQMQDTAGALAIAEPAVPAGDGSSGAVASSITDPTAATPPGAAAGQSLIDATSDVYFRTKAADVWWMLRGLAGDEALKQALQAYRRGLEVDPKLDRDPAGFERTLERATHKDLHWFFEDWVYRDRGLPDLSIVSVTPRQLEARGGQPAGWLVAVDVHNDGYAAADVPVTVRGAKASETLRLRVPAQASASTRIVFAGTPEEVLVNDGGTPETRVSLHSRLLSNPTPQALPTP